MAVFTPSPLMGEGGGEGGEVGTSLCFGKGCPPRFALPARGEGARSGFCVSPNSFRINSIFSETSVLSVAKWI